MQDDFQALLARGNALFHVDIPTDSGVVVHAAANNEKQRADSNNQGRAVHAKKTSTRRTTTGSKRSLAQASPRRRAAPRPQPSADHVSGLTDPSVASEAAAMLARHAFETMLEEVGDDEEARQELLALSSTVESFHNSKRRRYAQQRAKEVQALDTSLQQAVQHMQQEAEKAKENASAAIQEDAARSLADVQKMLEDFDQMRTRLVHQLQRKHAEVDAACKRKLKELKQATTDKHRSLQKELVGIVQHLNNACNSMVDTSKKRLERIGEQESAHLHKYQRALAKLTSSVTEISA